MEYDFNVREANGNPVAEKELLKKLEQTTSSIQMGGVLGV